jgi:hypothetical protein
MTNSVERLAQMKDFMKVRAGAVELPCGQNNADHPRGRHARAVLPDVLSDATTGPSSARRSSNASSWTDEGRVSEALHSRPSTTSSATATTIDGRFSGC